MVPCSLDGAPEALVLFLSRGPFLVLLLLPLRSFIPGGQGQYSCVEASAGKALGVLLLFRFPFFLPLLFLSLPRIDGFCGKPQERAEEAGGNSIIFGCPIPVTTMRQRLNDVASKLADNVCTSVWFEVQCLSDLGPVLLPPNPLHLPCMDLA